MVKTNSKMMIKKEKIKSRIRDKVSRIKETDREMIPTGTRIMKAKSLKVSKIKYSTK